MADEIVNKVAQSGLIQIDLEEYYPKQEIVELPLENFLYEGLILREKEFRTQLAETDWSVYEGKVVLIKMPEDAIVPSWAVLLLSTYLNGIAYKVHCGSRESYILSYYQEFILGLDTLDYQDKRLIIKGCADKDIPENAFLMLIERLQPEVKSLMYGEACSTVPLYKKK